MTMTIFQALAWVLWVVSDGGPKWRVASFSHAELNSHLHRVDPLLSSHRPHISFPHSGHFRSPPSLPFLPSFTILCHPGTSPFLPPHRPIFSSFPPSVPAENFSADQPVQVRYRSDQESLSLKPWESVGPSTQKCLVLVLPPSAPHFSSVSQAPNSSSSLLPAENYRKGQKPAK
ncbi:hypothetical protein BO85DRAFT_433414 [Aspergillus piperis CBS 112811]|uniref:Uncharacterized protein n=1 Tax=Aspergillus piperis CBS 112811 TaxID=1448313 RepID=A0A8G1VSD4_9EURO|nr:hypothetical protein BO85DRAFT_433414 [Aspergillus piperis CBS 112811]RAH62825.1 hypothetical protein BO85DRAFT_433414 [Aspergillus piperis CBS 112811]